MQILESLARHTSPPDCLYAWVELSLSAGEEKMLRCCVARATAQPAWSCRAMQIPRIAESPSARMCVGLSHGLTHALASHSALLGFW